MVRKLTYGRTPHTHFALNKYEGYEGMRLELRDVLGQR